MNKIVSSKKFRLYTGIIILITALLITFFTLLLWSSSYSTTQVKVAASLVEKAQEAQKQGAVLKLNKEELNQIITMYFNKEKSIGGITVKSIDGDIVNNNLVIYAPVTYKGFSMLLSSEGSLSYENGRIQYKPLYFRVGRINIPKGFVLNKLENKLKDNIIIEDGIIAVNESLIPVVVKSVAIKDNHILVGVEKAATLEEKLKSIQNSTKNNLNNTGIGNVNSGIANNSTDNSGGKETSNSQTSSSNKDTSQMDNALDRISSSLGSAMGSVSNSKQKAVISEMISVINSMKGNPSADPYLAAASVKLAYKALSAQEKAELKSVVFSNVNGSDINIVSKMLAN